MVTALDELVVIEEKELCLLKMAFLKIYAPCTESE